MTPPATVATDELPLLQVPPEVGSLKVIDDPMITKSGPEIADTMAGAFTVTVAEALYVQVLDVMV